MDDLKLKNPEFATNFGTPQADCNYEDVIVQLVIDGWREDGARRHLDAAIAAGAYERMEEDKE
jgi:hypothetical protein